MTHREAATRKHPNISPPDCDGQLTVQRTCKGWGGRKYEVAVCRDCGCLVHIYDGPLAAEVPFTDELIPLLRRTDDHQAVKPDPRTING